MTDERRVLDRRTKEGREEWARLLAEHDGDRDAANDVWNATYVAPKVAAKKVAAKPSGKPTVAPTAHVEPPTLPEDAPSLPVPVGESQEEMKARLRAEMQAEIMADLKRELAAEIRQEVMADVAASRQTPAESLEEQLRDPKLNVTPDPEVDGVTVNFVEDGLTLLGKVWARGEVVTVRRGSREWKELTQRDGRMLLEFDEDDQIDRWGRRMFRPGVGRWKFDFNDPNLLKDYSDAEIERLRTIQKERDELAAAFASRAVT